MHRQQIELQAMKKKYEDIMIKLKTNDRTQDKDREETGNIPEIQNSVSTDQTPTKRVAEFINQTIPNIDTPKKEEISKKLIEHSLLQESFKMEYKKSNTTEKNVLKRLVNNDIMMKYKQGTKFKITLGIQNSTYQKIGENRRIFNYSKKLQDFTTEMMSVGQQPEKKSTKHTKK